MWVSIFIDMLLGYARVSTQDQNLQLQLDALNKLGCENIYQDCISGVRVNRPGLEALFQFMREGDTLVVWRLDRLGRSLSELIKVITMLEKRGVIFHSIKEGINTETPQGRMFFHVFGTIAEFEREMIKERTIAGLQAARLRGVVGGRPKGLSKKNQEKVRMAINLRKEGVSATEIAKRLGISRASVYHYFLR